jgi:hypothetical protein
MTYVDSNCTPSMLAIVSLMRDDSVEVRLLKPGKRPPAEGGAPAEPGFGIFKLRRQDGTCF